MWYESENLKRIPTRLIVYSLLTIFISLCYSSDVIHYDGGSWAPSVIENYRVPNIPHDSAYNRATVFGYQPLYDYPLGPATFVGMTDTFRIDIRIFPPHAKEYVITGSNPESWFEPVVFEVEQDIYNENPYIEADQLGYHIIGWRHRQTPMQKPDTIKPYKTTSMMMEVWDVPEGIYRLVVQPTDSIPKDFAGRRSGQAYFYWQPTTITDSINAWNDLFWRALEDSNLIVAKQWLDSIQTYNSKSAPGYALAARLAVATDDSASVVAAYDNAISSLTDFDDPAIPDTSDPYDRYLYKRWYEHYLKQYEKHRDRYMNYPDERSWFLY